MPTASAVLPLCPPSDSPVTAADVRVDASAALHATLERLRAALQTNEPFAATLDELTSEVAKLSRRQRDSLVVDQLRALLPAVAAAHAGGGAIDVSTLLRARSLATGNWPGLLAAMLALPAWQWPEAPLLDAVPDWLWGDYVTWTFTPPIAFTCAGDAEIYAAHFLRHAEQLARWAARNPGSAAVQAALNHYRAALPAAFAPLLLSAGSLRRHAEAHGQLVTRLVPASAARSGGLVPRHGRRLSVGVLLREADAAAGAAFELLDPSRFDVSVFLLPGEAAGGADAPPAQARRLPAAPAEQLAEVLAARLDVAVFAGDLTGAVDDLAVLAAQRLAPLQVATSASPGTTGLPTLDLYVTGTLAALNSSQTAAKFVERLALIPGPARVAPLRVALTATPERNLADRAALQLAETSVVLLLAAPLAQITPETQDLCARLLHAAPAARLVVQPLPGENALPESIPAFCTRFDVALAKHGCAADQMIVLDRALSTLDDVRDVAAIADLGLELVAGSTPDVLHALLAAGLPVVTAEGATVRSRQTASTLRALGLEACIAAHPGDTERLVLELTRDPERRQALRTATHAALERTSPAVDTLAYADGFGGLVEAAFDRLAEIGRNRFRDERTSLLTPFAAALVDEQLTEAAAQLEAYQLAEAAQRVLPVLARHPDHKRARHLLGRILLAQGQTERATTYLLAAVESPGSGVAEWHALGLALHAGGRIPEAVVALETCVRIEPAQLEPWLLLADWAEAAGNTSLCAEIVGVVQELAPADPRVRALATRVSF